MATDSRKRSRGVKAGRRIGTIGKTSGAGGLLVLATNPDYEVLCSQTLNRLPTRLRSVVSSQSAKSKAPSGSRWTLVVSRLTDISRTVVQHAERAETTRQVIFVNEFPIEAVVDRLMCLQIRSSHRLHIASKRDKNSEAELLYRLVTGMAEHDGSKSIVDAWVEGEDLVLLSPSFERMIVPSKMLGRYLGDDLSKLSNFEIDEDGRFLWWSHSDTHLGWKQLHQLIDPTVALEDAKKSHQFMANYGSAIRTLRESSGLKQSDIVGLTPRQLRRIEHGEQVVTKKALEALSLALGIPIDTYLRKLAKLATVNASNAG